ncbi:hypothetical protein [Dyadobacter sp. CY312]|uniref:hypothetical protein n=1 Tax=Dyadobacter sp. CY312 TaxID=2907303 RepID=UPI001F36E76C|nr:hypothetical protein [Dyadobacter sp. CY312]MCE7043195.1 hypothetical protein [Dyadobacter sp. CY312]
MIKQKYDDGIEIIANAVIISCNFSIIPNSPKSLTTKGTREIKGSFCELGSFCG